MSDFALVDEGDNYYSVIVDGVAYVNEGSKCLGDLTIPKDYEFCCGDISLKNPENLSIKGAFIKGVKIRNKRYFLEFSESGLYFVVLEVEKEEEGKKRKEMFYCSKNETLKDLQIPPNYEFFVSGSKIGGSILNVGAAFKMGNKLYIQKTHSYVPPKVKVPIEYVVPPMNISTVSGNFSGGNYTFNRPMVNCNLGGATVTHHNADGQSHTIKYPTQTPNFNSAIPQQAQVNVTMFKNVKADNIKISEPLICPNFSGATTNFYNS